MPGRCCNCKPLNEVPLLVAAAMEEALERNATISFPAAPGDQPRITLAHAEFARRIVAAIIAMAHSLGLSVVAEGVETGMQRAYLQARTCDEFQGYLFSKLAPADEFTTKFLKPQSAPA